ncbi:hypothetical protein [Fulvivirga sedimenti]|uniref:DUF4175 domain-containing protein n=1 Tax=Fulvivirga sedimenti TaxID=2879465 RepID=A0A9X1HUG8_9BACT|nr:hypothetical protein [Fulvivirga sedimenti]MCA6078519.1 hypothetical protein [Fulvivirga sedimenti]
MEPRNTHINQKIQQYKRRYYYRLLLQGLMLGAGILLSIFVFVILLEALFHFSSVIRGILLFGLIGTFIFVCVKYLGTPALVLSGLKSGMSETEAASRIGKYFPGVGDKLLNLLQLQQQANGSRELAEAGILQKLEGVKGLQFTEAVDFSKNKPYVKYAVVPAVVLIAVAIISPSLIPDSTNRILRFTQEFVPEAPFAFTIENNLLRAFRNEDFELAFRLEGQNIPDHAYLIDKDRRIKLFPDASGTYRYTYRKIQSDRQFAIEAAGFTSSSNEIDVVDRPDLLGFDVTLTYPPYLNRKNERRENAGNLRVPEGTKVTWMFNTQTTDSLSIYFGDEVIPASNIESNSNVFTFTRDLRESHAYKIFLSNTYGTNRDPIVFEAEVLTDEFPQIAVDVYKDTLRYDFVAFRGDVSDDHGIRQLMLYHRNRTESAAGEFRRDPIPVSDVPNQRFYYQWDLDSLDRIPGTELEFYVRVWDNDGVNGMKSQKSPVFVWRIPGAEEIDEELERIAEKTSNTLDKTINKAEELEKRVQEAEERLKGKRELNFQDEMFMKELLQKRRELEQAIEQLQEQNKESLSQRDRFNKDQNEQIKEKAEQLQKLMDELLDEETKKLYEELQRLLEEQRNIDEFRQNLSELNRKESNLSKELERTLELFKRLKLEQKTQEGLEKLTEQLREQEELLKKTEKEAGEKDFNEKANEPDDNAENKDGQENKGDDRSQEGDQQDKDQNAQQDKQNNDSGQNEELLKEQEELQQKFEELKEDIEEIEELNQDLNRPQSLPDTEEEQQEISESQQKSKESLEQNNKKSSQQSQQKAVQKMKQMKQKMEEMQSSMEMDVMMENMDDLRDIMHNLLTLSFDQEELIEEFKDVQQSDPRFVTLGQEQLKIRDDAQVVEDSLLALAQRVFQLQAFVTREVENMNYHLDKSLEGIKERKKPNAASEQQFAMTAMNNLALLLDDVMEQMQDAMANPSGQGGKPGQKQPMPSLSELQQQLNQQIQDLKNSGKSGRELSEELARLAAEQERIRQAFQEMQRQFMMDNEGNKGKEPGQGLPEKMEETETDLVNKQLTEEMIQRQRDILTRMLESEDALREQDKDEQRKGETAKDYENIKPKAFEDYFKLREQEIELLRTLPPKLFPYYKKEVNEYFKRLGDTGN